VSFVAITLCVASQRVFVVVVVVVIVVYFVMTQSGNFWIHPHSKAIGRSWNSRSPKYCAEILTTTRQYNYFVHGSNVSENRTLRSNA
jgi:hypothetical protein